MKTLKIGKLVGTHGAVAVRFASGVERIFSRIVRERGSRVLDCVTLDGKAERVCASEVVTVLT